MILHQTFFLLNSINSTQQIFNFDISKECAMMSKIVKDMLENDEEVNIHIPHNFEGKLQLRTKDM